MTKKDLFIELAKPNENGESRWVSSSEFVGKYKVLQLGNGGSWCRASSSLAKEYQIEFDKSITSDEGNEDAIIADIYDMKEFQRHLDLYAQEKLKEWLDKTNFINISNIPSLIDKNLVIVDELLNNANNK